MSSGDPRVQQQRTRLPKSYTDQQLAFLKSHLPEFERRTQGSIRGDAKKFALEKAADFISAFGLPNEFIHVEEAEPRFKEQIYNWFKNTVGRTRRKLEGRPRSMKKVLEKEGALNNTLNNAWSTGLSLTNSIWRRTSRTLRSHVGT
ncbi:Sterol 24-C-methyltransferase [Lentinula edodes]|uniref:Sterol 24-C-methyltransferase n=1 Tax=Lentinula edodes TaxID=5353 RepID=A0A1Q3DY22_LENED|nr:Sterol 24-C-methyltransferase [Lentinula edodes]